MSTVSVAAEASRLKSAYGPQLAEALTEFTSVFSLAEAEGALAAHDWAKLKEPAPAAEVRQHLAAELVGDDRIVVKLGEDQGEAHFTTRAMQQLERRMLEDAFALHNEDHGALSGKQRRHQVEDYGHRQTKKGREGGLDARLAALDHLLEPGELKLLDGPPGSGKSNLIKALVDATEGTDRAAAGIVGTAISPKIAAELADDAGVPGVPLADLLADLKKGESPVRRNGTIILDEAGMVGSQEMANLVDYAQKAEVKLVLIGDAKQIPPADAGQPFRNFIERLPHASLTEIHRQKYKVDRNAAMNLRDGKGDKAVDSFIERGLVKWLRGPSAAIDALANDYTAWAVNPDHETKLGVILVPDAATADAANQRVREIKKLDGHLSDAVPVTTPDGVRELGTGDRLMLQEAVPLPGKKGGMTAYRGTTGTVTSVEDGQIAIDLDGYEKRSVTIDPASAPSFSYAYALDLRQAQGITVDRAFVGVTRPITPGEGLVALTRHESKASVTIDQTVYPDRTALAADLMNTRPEPTTLDFEPTVTARRGLRH